VIEPIGLLPIAAEHLGWVRKIWRREGRKAG